MSYYKFIDQQRVTHPVRRLCQVLAVAPNCYYAWRQRAASPVAEAAPASWKAALVQTFTHHKRRYGTRRLRAELLA